MSLTIVPETLAESASTAERARARQASLLGPCLLLAIAATSITIGIVWDISWHLSIGRDTFWTPAHMAIYLGGAMSGCVGGWLAFKTTFFATPEERAASVSILGARAPLGAWIAMWGSLALITSAPFDNWWHNAYGLDVKIVSPPHALLGLGMLGISVGALLLVLAHQNRAKDALGSAIFIYVGGIFLTLASVFVTEASVPNLQHAAPFYEIAAATFLFRIVSVGRAGRVSWSATKASAVYTGFMWVMIWILPLFPAQPKLAPIFNPVTHMVPPFFPLLLVFPALAIDLILRRWGGVPGLARQVAVALALSAAFLAVFVAVQWPFAEFLLSPSANNWVFGGSRQWGYATVINPGLTRFWHAPGGRGTENPVDAVAILLSLFYGGLSAWIGLVWGNWMRKVQR